MKNSLLILAMLSSSLLPANTGPGKPVTGGRRVLVITNAGSAQSVALRLDEQTTVVSLPKNSLTTLAWS